MLDLFWSFFAVCGQIQLPIRTYTVNEGNGVHGFFSFILFEFMYILDEYESRHEIWHNFNNNLCMIFGSVQIIHLIDRVFILINIIDTSCRLRNVMRKVLLVLKGSYDVAKKNNILCIWWNAMCLCGLKLKKHYYSENKSHALFLCVNIWAVLWKSPHIVT